MNGSTKTSSPSDARIIAAIDAIFEALALKPSARAELETCVAGLGREGTAFPKLPYVSFYAAKSRGGVNYRITFRVKGHPLRTERLGKMPRPAYKRAQRVSEILQQVNARLMKPADAYRELYVDNTPIERHVKDFIASLRAKGNVDDYIASTETRLTRCVDLGDYARLSDITRASQPALIERLRSYVEPGKNKPLSSSTINQYLGTLRQFMKWATPTRIPENPLLNMQGVKNEDRKKRRDILIEELAKIVAMARSKDCPVRSKMRGADRAMLYLFAFGTGLRRNECRLTQIPWLKVDHKPPFASIPGVLDGKKITKNRKDAHIPLPTWLAAELKSWLGQRRTGRLFEYFPGNIASVFDRDRDAARNAWVAEAKTDEERKEREESDFLKRHTVDGEIVFHSHRHGYASSLVAAMDPKSAQILTRHSSMAMLERYAHGRVKKAAEGVDRAIQDPMKPSASA